MKGMFIPSVLRCVRYLADTLFPARCILCSSVFIPDAKKPSCLCNRCSAELELQRIGNRHCPYCGQRLVSEDGICLCCRELETMRIPGKAIYSYRGAARYLLKRFKFDGFRQVAELFADDIAASIPASMASYLIVPLPSGKHSYRRNGWGHMESVAEILGQQGYNVSPGLLKRKNRGEQKRLGRAERYNQGKRFICRSSSKGRKVILIDDVRTTGSSLQAAADTLISSGYFPAVQIVIAID